MRSSCEVAKSTWSRRLDVATMSVLDQVKVRPLGPSPPRASGAESGCAASGCRVPDRLGRVMERR
ncbi:hypothetical protein [Acetobacter nitrogenifigens]|uniref:hypothetical protein n=1 Tax=Acetobacter nitrogenifigens TaxID=285268 RepID=UPI0011BD8EE3|nr:hypothetical protein [Acetobacter nitrogenifigens]